jgi:HD superfamily phosphohydrolases
MSKQKIINDPVFGFITIPDKFIYNLIEHPYLQRLNRIKQMGLASLVYPGAQHTRFHHSLGAMFLTDETIKQLRSKGHIISHEDYLAVLSAILLHDIGHGPFSHALENILIEGIDHEDISLLLMKKINQTMEGALDPAIAVFQDRYPKQFLHQLICGQLDMDRLDYLRRDSFFTGVIEGNIGSARIIKMLTIQNDRLVVEEKGIYSIENFLMARRLMYWQVYLHKTAVAAEKMLVNTLNRAKELAGKGIELFAAPSLRYFLYNHIDKNVFLENPQAAEHFTNLDDTDIWSALKTWTQHPDKVLSVLSSGLINRKLFKIKIASRPFEPAEIKNAIRQCAEQLNISERDAGYLVSSDEVSSNMYNEEEESIDILYKDGSIRNIAEASDIWDIALLSKKIKKYYFCYLKPESL